MLMVVRAESCGGRVVMVFVMVVMMVVVRLGGSAGGVGSGDSE